MENFDTLTLTHGATITGGMDDGVWNDGMFTLSGGTISGNSAANGGGVYVGPMDSLELNGGTFQNNTASSNGGGISARSTFTLNTAGVHKHPPGSISSVWAAYYLPARTVASIPMVTASFTSSFP